MDPDRPARVKYDMSVSYWGPTGICDVSGYGGWGEGLPPYEGAPPGDSTLRGYGALYDDVDCDSDPECERDGYGMSYDDAGVCVDESMDPYPGLG
jgi:hypothetical protein